jgi:hypothetical protein
VEKKEKKGRGRGKKAMRNHRQDIVYTIQVYFLFLFFATFSLKRKQQQKKNL